MQNARVKNAQDRLAERLVGASVDLYGTADARDVCRYVSALLRDLVPAADGNFVGAHCDGQMVTLGVYGFPHYGSTLTVSRQSRGSTPFWVTESVWARTPHEVAELVRDESEASERFRRFSATVAATGRRSLILVPGRLDDEVLTVLGVDAWTRPGAFHRADLDRLELVAKVTALALAATSYATLHGPDGRAERRPMRVERSDTGAAVSTQPAGIVRDVTPARAKPVPRLSERESEILRLVRDGFANAEIAARLYVSVNTVRTHRRGLMGKLDAHNVAELLGRARDLGLLD